MYDERADNVEQAMNNAAELLESLAEIAIVDDEYGTQISQMLDDLKYANTDLDNMDTDFGSMDTTDYESRVLELESAVNVATSDLESIQDEISTVVRDLEWA